MNEMTHKFLLIISGVITILVLSQAQVLKNYGSQGHQKISTIHHQLNTSDYRNERNILCKTVILRGGGSISLPDASVVFEVSSNEEVAKEASEENNDISRIVNKIRSKHFFTTMRVHGNDLNSEKDCITEFVGECALPTKRGVFRLRAYRSKGNKKISEPLAIIYGEIGNGVNVPLRVHDQCATSEVFGSMRCDCNEQLELSFDFIKSNGGIIIYMPQEGRGIGLANKIAAYALQDQGLDTVDANRRLGFDDDHRSYEAVKYILNDLGVTSVQLMTNNPFKLESMEALGINIESRIPIVVPPNRHSEQYLLTKLRRMRHYLPVEQGSGFFPTNANDSANDDETVESYESDLEVRSLGPSKEELDAEETEAWAFGRKSVIDAIEAIEQGKLVVVTDDEDRENEGDLICAGSMATEDLLAFMIRHTSGVICVSMEGDRLDELQIPPMVDVNEDPKATAFTVTVDAKKGTTTGISAADRSVTIMSLAQPHSTAGDFNRPGHVFPLRYREGGVLKRAGHTEAALDLARLAGLPPVGVLCEITTKDGRSMARLPELREFCEEHKLVLTSIRDMRCYLREKTKDKNYMKNGNTES